MAKLFKNSVKNLLKNKIVLYVLVALALTNILGYISMNNNKAIVLFISLGLITSFFSKNMILILAVPLILVNLLISVNVGIEAMSNKKEETKETKESVEGMENEDEKEVEKEDVVEDVEEGLLNKKGSLKVGKAVDLAEMEPMLNRAEGMLNRIEKLSSIFNGKSKN